MTGIDISNHQAGLDLAQAKAGGIEFVVLKATEGRTWTADSFAGFYEQAKGLGLPVGCYCYSHATTESAAEAEAGFLLNFIKGKDMPLGVYMDVEKSEQFALSNSQLAGVIQAFCRVIRSAGYTPGLYGSQLNVWAKVNDSLPNYVLRWVARYGSQPTISCDLWQKADNGRVQGYGKNVDIDVAMSQRMINLINGKQDYKPPVVDPVEATFPPDPSIKQIQYVMWDNGYWDIEKINGYKSDEFFEAYFRFGEDMKSC